MITVFTSCYNQGKFLAEAIESVLKQSYGDFEYLIYDDGSTDDTWEIINSYDDSRIKAFKLKKVKNIATVLNMSISKMKGRVWSWCPSDDIWHAKLLSDKRDFALALGPNAVIYSDWEVINEDGSHHIMVKPRISFKDFPKVVWDSSPIGFTGIWIPRKVFDIVGGFPEHIDFSEDYYWMVKATIHNILFYSYPKVLYKKRRHLDQLSNINRSNIQFQLPMIRQELKEYMEKIK